MSNIVEIAKLSGLPEKIRKMAQRQLTERSRVSQRQIVAFENVQATNLGFISILGVWASISTLKPRADGPLLRSSWLSLNANAQARLL